jgi:glc operon protein GlcG
MDPVKISAMLHTALGEAQRMELQVVIAVVDHAGRLAGLLRMPDAFFVSDSLAVDKAWSAAGLRLATRDLGALLETMPSSVRDGLLQRERLTVVPGGLPLIEGTRCCGGVGVSGGSAEQDEAIAQVMAACFVRETD